MKNISKLATVLFILACLISFPGCTKKTPPNILLITIDTLRADHLGCYGYNRRISPTLDRLAAEGVLFENAYTTMPATIPSHGSIFFGTWPRVHGSTSNYYMYSNKKLQYFPRLLQNSGYTTAAFISRDHLLRAIQEVGGFHTLTGSEPREERRADETLSLTRNWFEKTKPARFFVWVHLWDTHGPYSLHPRFMKNIHPGFKRDFERRYSYFPEGTYDAKGIQKMVDLYDNEIAFLDFHLGRFLADLRQRHYLDNTILIVTSDHGETLDEIVGTHSYGFDHGEFLFDSELHIPLIIVPPENKQPGRRIRETATLLDLMPTILEATGLRIPDTVHGVSLWKSIRDGEPGKWPELVFLHRSKYAHRPQPYLREDYFGVREKNFKLIYAAESGEWTLYRNSAEHEPLAGEDTAKKRLQQRVANWLQLTERLKSPVNQTVSEDVAEELRSLGYVQ